MNSFTPIPQRGRDDSRRIFAEAFRNQIVALESGRAKVRIPQARELYVARPGMAYHFKPELFVQRGGETAFTVTVPAATQIGRYRVSFRTNDRVIPHIDRRDRSGN